METPVSAQTESTEEILSHTLYHLYTEYRPNLPEIVSRHFDGFTLLQGAGYWLGNSEASAILEILVPTSDTWNGLILALARDIKDTNNQQSVYVTQTPVAFTEVS